MLTAGELFSSKRGLREFIQAGPYSAILDEFARGLQARGLSLSTIQGYVRGARHVTHALEQGWILPEDLTLAKLRHFARVHGRACRCPHPEAPSQNAYSAMAPLHEHLARRGIAPVPARRPAFHSVMDRFTEYLREAKGAADDTIASIRDQMTRALEYLMPDGQWIPSSLTNDAANGYVLHRTGKVSAKAGKKASEVLRAFCRYLHACGEPVLADARSIVAPKVPKRFGSLVALSESQLRELVGCPSISRSNVLRDEAIVLTLARTGIRRRDITRLRLEDFLAREGELLVRERKSRKADRVPIPNDVRDAILRYVMHERLRGATCGALFLTAVHPYDKPISSSGVSSVARRTFVRSGIGHSSRGTHVFRHTVASTRPADHVAAEFTPPR